MGTSSSHQGQWRCPIGLIGQASRTESLYLSKTLRSQLRLMSTHSGTLTRMPLSSSSRSYKAVKQWMTSTTSITCSLACKSCSLKISRAVVKVTRSTGKERRKGRWSPKKQPRALMKQGYDITKYGMKSTPIIGKSAISLSFTTTPILRDSKAPKVTPVNIAHLCIHRFFHICFENTVRCEWVHVLHCIDSRGVISHLKFLCLQRFHLLKIILEVQRADPWALLMLGTLSPSQTLGPISVPIENRFVQEPCSRKLRPGHKGWCMAGWVWHTSGRHNYLWCWVRLARALGQKDYMNSTPEQGQKGQWHVCSMPMSNHGNLL